MHSILVTLTAAALGFAPGSQPAAHQQVLPNAGTNARVAGSRMSALESQLLGRINNTRARRGLRPFRLSSKLTAAARQHSASMADRGYFSHDSADGGSFWKRIATFYGYRGYRSWSVGENLLWSSPDVSSSGALNMWMNSPEHRANLLDRNWREIGISAVHATSAPGVYSGDEVTIVTADFGSRN